MKIKQLEIQNFQSHKDTTIDLDPGINVLIGETDAGKTSVIRAIKWLCLNRPTGDSFIHWNTNECSVCIDFEDGQIARIKNKKFNGYVLGMHDEFQGFGSSIPEEIKDFLNMGEINFQYQFDGPFMLSNAWTPGRRGIFVNDITDLSIMDTTIKNIKSTIRKEKGDLEHYESLEKELKKRVEEYDYLEQMEEDIEELEELEEELQLASNFIEYLEKMIIEVEEAQNFLEELKDVPKIEKEVNRLIEQAKHIQNLRDRRFYLGNTLKGIRQCNNTLAKRSNTVKNTVKIKNLYLSMGTLKKARKTALWLQDTIIEIEEAQNRIDELKEDLKITTERLENEFPSICPLCNQEVVK